MSPRRALSLTFALTVAASLVASAALGDPSNDARTLFNVGATAYERGDFKSAIQAFEQAYRVSPRPGILFSIAQAHRKQYIIDKKAGHVPTALLRLRQYIEQVPVGERRADAVTALAELEPIAAELERRGELAAIEKHIEEDDPSRLMVSSSAPDATVVVDGKKTLTAPFSVEIDPGPHTLDVRAPGFVDDRRSIVVAPKAVTALDIALRERASRVAIGGPDGARVTLDGRDVGALPLAGPLEVGSGGHRVLVRKPGRTDYFSEVRLGRGEGATIDAQMPLTFQRKMVYSLLGVTLAAGAAGGVFTGLAFRAQSEATSLRDAMIAGEVTCKSTTCPPLDDYESAADTLRQMRDFAGATLVLTALSGAATLALFLWEAPSATPPAALAPAESPSAPKRPAKTDISLAPLVSPSLGGAALFGRF